MSGLLLKKKIFLFLNIQNKKNKVEILTIKSGKKGPHIKKGIIDAVIKLIKTEFEYLRLFIKILQLLK